MALPAGRYGVTKNQLLKIKKLPMNTIKLIEELTEKFDLLGTAAFKNSTSVVTESTDLVESGAVFDALAEKVSYADNGVLGAKNRLDASLENAIATNIGGTWAGNVHTVSSIAFTVYDDNHVKANGTATATANHILQTDVLIKGGIKWHLSGAPSGLPANCYLRAYTNGYAQTFLDTGNGVDILFDADTLISVDIRIASGSAISDKMFYPMIRLATDPDPTYQPYAETNRELTVNKADNSVIGTVEGANASKAWSVGEHFIKDGQFKEVTQPIASGGAISDSNTVNKPIADCLVKQDSFSGTTDANGQMSITNTTARKVIKVVLDTNFLICLLYQRSDGESIKVVDASFQPWAEQTISGTYYYI